MHVIDTIVGALVGGASVIIFKIASRNTTPHHIFASSLFRHVEYLALGSPSTYPLALIPWEEIFSR